MRRVASAISCLRSAAARGAIPAQLMRCREPWAGALILPRPAHGSIAAALRDWSRSFFEELKGYGIEATAAFSMELQHGDPSAIGTCRNCPAISQWRGSNSYYTGLANELLTGQPGFLAAGLRRHGKGHG